MTSYRTREVARMLGWSPQAVRTCVRDGYTHPVRGEQGEYHFSFQDLVVLRSVKDLIDSGLPKRKIRLAMGELVDQLPPERTLAGVRIVADGDRVVVRDGDEVWNPVSGQRLLDWEATTGSAGIERPLAHEVRSDTDEPDFSAEDWYQVGIDLEPTDPAEAKVAYRKAVEIDPTHVDAHLNLGRMLHEEGRVRSAHKQYQAALEASPEHSTALFNLGVALEDLGRPMEALSAYEKVISLDTSYADAYFNISGIYERLGKRAEALRYLKTYKSLTDA
jgi:DNA-binding transcriptional MerR regulator